jgi:hypothetical protein
MRFPARLLFPFFLFILAANLLPAQTPSPAPSPQSTDPQAAALLVRSAAALRGNAPLSDVTLTGSARRIVGSDDESGQVVVKARAAGQSRLDLNLPSGKHSESRDVSPAVGAGFSPSSSSSTAIPSGQWSGPDGTPHDIAFHNLVAEPAWHSPAILLAQLQAKPNLVITNLGLETRNGAAVQHLSIAQAATDTSDTDRLMQHLTQLDLYLDPTTLLPASITFNIHPDNNALLDIPAEVRFSGYRTMNGAQIPFHIEKFLNNTLILDLQFANATLNSGLSASDFSL